MVDYSKWDRMEFSDSDSDEAATTPRVTSLDGPGSVTIGPDGIAEIGTPTPTPSGVSSSSSSPVAAERETTTAVSGIVSGSAGGDVVDISPGDDRRKSEPRRQPRARLTINGGEHRRAVDVDGRDVELPIYWSQDRRAVTLRLGLPPELFPSKDVRVRVAGALRYEDRFSAVGSGSVVASRDAGKSSDGDAPTFGSVEIVSLSNRNREEETVLLAGKLPRPIHLDEGEDEIDFQIEDNPLGRVGGNGGDGGEVKEGGCVCGKLATITMPKAVPMAGMVVWWDRPLVGHPRIDVSAIEGRNIASKRREGGEEGGGGDKKEAFQKAWEEAHEMFREKMKTKEKRTIEIDD